jgi:hypothetical protein
MKIPCKNIPTYLADEERWVTTSFDNQQQFGEFLMTHCFKEPGEYDFDESTKKWNVHAKHFQEHGFFTDLPERTKDWEDFWDGEKMKCRLGVIWKSGNRYWYITRDYYFILNFLPITNKEKGQIEDFCSIRDVQYHMMLYEKLAEIFHKHSAELKRRQMMYSFCHVAKCVNYLWFENRKTIKIFASDDVYLNEENGVWKTFNSYKEFLNLHTGWQRVFTPDKYPGVAQIEKIKIRNKWHKEGNESTMVAFTCKTDPKKGVGGPCYYAWYEEGGIAPTANLTLQYMNPAFESGTERVGSFCIGGSVGDLDECIPLQNMIEKPTAYGVFAVPTKWWDDTGVERMCGLFIPAQYGLPEATDEYGNTNVAKALEELDRIEREEWSLLPPEEYILRKSQNPRTIDEAFKVRKVSEYPIQLLQNQQERIKLKDSDNKWDFKPIKCLLAEDRDGKIIMQRDNLPDEHKYPIKPEWADKRGVVTIYEMPLEENPKFYTYFGGLDPIEADETTTSESVASLDIIRKAHKVKYKDKDGKEQIRIEGDKLVATYRGRFDTAERTNEQMWLLIRMYNAFTLVERSKPNFINYMRRMGRDHYLARESDIPLFRDININSAFETKSPFGFIISHSNNMWKYLKDTLKSYLKAEYGYVYKEGGEVLKVMRGIDRIDDYWLLEEIIRFVEGDGRNYDRKISFMAAMALCKINEINVGITTVYEVDKDKKEKKPVQQATPVSLLGGYKKPTRTIGGSNKTRSLI